MAPVEPTGPRPRVGSAHLLSLDETYRAAGSRIISS